MWPKLTLIAQDLVAWTKRLSVDGEVTEAELERPRYRPLHQARRVARSGRKTRCASSG